MAVKRSDKGLIEEIERAADRHLQKVSSISEFRKQYYGYLKSRGIRWEESSHTGRLHVKQVSGLTKA